MPQRTWHPIHLRHHWCLHIVSMRWGRGFDFSSVSHLVFLSVALVHTNPLLLLVEMVFIGLAVASLVPSSSQRKPPPPHTITCPLNHWILSCILCTSSAYFYQLTSYLSASIWAFSSPSHSHIPHPLYLTPIKHWVLLQKFLFSSQLAMFFYRSLRFAALSFLFGPSYFRLFLRFLATFASLEFK